MPTKPPAPFTERDIVPARMMAEMIARGLDEHGDAWLAAEVRTFAQTWTGVSAEGVEREMRRRVKKRHVFRPW